jgi:hypothetical protein
LNYFESTEEGCRVLGVLEEEKGKREAGNEDREQER